MHFTASPAAYFTAAYERMLFTKHSLKALRFICCRATAVTSVAQALARWKMLMCSIAKLCVRSRQTATQQRIGVSHCKRRGLNAAANLVGGRADIRGAAFETRRANIRLGACKEKFREASDGPIRGGHHCGDAAYGGHGVFGRAVDVRGGFDGQQLQYTAHVGARRFFGADAIAAFHCRTIALTASGS